MNLEFHHLGVACRRISTSLNYYQSLGYIQESELFVDPVIGIKCLFIKLQDSPRIELCEALPGNDALSPWLASGSPIYHLAFKVNVPLEDFKTTSGEKIVFGPIPAVAFQGKKVWFTLRANRQLVEYIEDDK